MKKIKININRAPVSKEEIDSKRNFENILAQVMSYSKPFYQTKLFLNSILVLAFATVVVYTVYKLERETEKAKAHENDGYAAISAVREIGSVDSLETQEFVVQIGRDTILNTAKGAFITVPAGALQAPDKDVVLIVREAYTIEDMIRAGLTTKSGKQLLSSGGMFYIQAKDSANVKITKAITVRIPTDEVNPEMKLFTGQTTSTGKIDWQDPVALKTDITKVVSEGQTLFEENCKSCHRLGEDAVGPDLAYIGKRRDFYWIKRYVKSSMAMMGGACRGTDVGYIIHHADSSTKVVYGEAATASSNYLYNENDEYAVCLYNNYNKSIMPSFLSFGDKEIKALCDYFNVESKRLNLPYPKDELYINFQKCKTYKALISKLYDQKSKLKSKRIVNVADNGSFVKQVDRSMQVLQMPSNAAVISSDDRKSYVYPVNKQSEYYQVEINTFGWYNIDMLAKTIPNIVDSKLFVQVSDSFASTFQIYLVLPEAKIYGAGGLLKDKKDVYGFYEDNGKIKLPQGKTAHVYLVGEKNGQLLYAAATFVTDTLNNLRLNPVLISKETFNVKIKELLQTEGMSVKAKDSKNAASLRKIDSDLNALEGKIKEAEKSKPKDCDCGCEREATDSTVVMAF